MATLIGGRWKNNTTYDGGFGGGGNGYIGGGGGGYSGGNCELYSGGGGGSYNAEKGE